MSDSFDAVQQLGSVPSQEQMADAWWKVAATLDQVWPGWQADAKSGADAACAAIRDMAGERALRDLEATESAAERAFKELTAKLGRPPRMKDLAALQFAVANAFLNRESPL